MSVVLLLAVVLGSSCKKLSILGEYVESLNGQQYTGLSYGADTLQKMDVYLPPCRNDSTKILILVHGGSWYSGDKSEFTSYATQLKNKGYAVINMNYRLVNQNGSVTLKQEQEDIKAVVDYAYDKAAEWHISNKIALIGASAGGHLSLLYTYTHTDAKVKTVVSIAGPTNLTDTRNATKQSVALVQALIGASPTINPQAYVNGSPIMKVSTGSRPTLIFHGRKDTTVPIQQSIDLKTSLNAAGVKSKLVIYETVGHEVISSGNYADFLANLDNWLQANLN